MREAWKMDRRRRRHDLLKKRKQQVEADDYSHAVATPGTHNWKYQLVIIILMAFVMAGVSLLSQQGGGLPSYLGSEIQKAMISLSSAVEAAPSKKNSKLADGCFHVFVDVGGSLGIHARFILEPMWYPDAVNTHNVLDGAFGPPSRRDNRDICTFAFALEPALDNSLPQKRLDLQSSYHTMGWTFIPVEANNKTTTLGFAANNEAEIEPGAALARWIQKEIVGRRLPEKVHGNYNATSPNGTGKIVLKLDVPGMEMLLSPRPTLRVTICQAIDLAYGEWTSYRGDDVYYNPVTGQGALSSKLFEDRAKAATHIATTWKTLTSTAYCKTKWLGLAQDEKQLKENIPLPATP
jgi:hypothetical protein